MEGLEKAAADKLADLTAKCEAAVRTERETCTAQVKEFTELLARQKVKAHADYKEEQGTYVVVVVVVVVGLGCVGSCCNVICCMCCVVLGCVGWGVWSAT